VGDFLILDALRESKGTAVGVPEDAISEMQTLAGGLGAGYVSPESAAALAAIPILRERGEVERNDEVVVFDCGIGQKYPPPQDLPEPPIVDPTDLDIEALAHSLR
jgi:threonine synthase